MIPGILRFLLINTDQLKDALHHRLTIPQGDPGVWYLHEENGEEYARHIISEEKRIDHRGVASWHATGANHWLDTEIYAMVAVDLQTAGGVRVLSKPVYAGKLKPVGVKKPRRPARPGYKRATYSKGTD